MDLISELTRAAAELRAGGDLPARLAAAMTALALARRVIVTLEEEGDPDGYPAYAMAAIEIIEADHAVRHAPSLPDGTEPPHFVRLAVFDCARSTTVGEKEQDAARALADLAHALETEFTDLEGAPVDDRLACLAVARNAAKWHEVLADGDVR